MNRRSGFVPAAFDRLEDRVVLSHAAARGVSVVVSGLFPHQQVLSRRHQPVVAEVNQAFDEFTSDYGQARATYFASIFNNPTPNMATTQAFTFFTKQRVSLLANEVISSFLQYSAGTARAKGKQNSLPLLVSQKLINPQGMDPPGSLARSLVETIPPAGTSAATASLYSLSQDNAIQSARVAVINGVNIVRNGDFGNKANSHH
jgi:hypothetical protein